MEQGTKRKADSQNGQSREKQPKTKKQWRVPKKGYQPQPNIISPGDSGIWVTCDKGREGKCTAELRDLFNEYAREIYGDITTDSTDDAQNDENEDESFDIEKEIKAEVSSIRRPTGPQLFTPMRIDVQCVLFLKTIAPIDPVSFIERICNEALSNPSHKRSRFARRLSPMTKMGRASEEGLQKVAKEVLAPVFHSSPINPRRFAIRPNIRNHNILSRDAVIKLVAASVGPGHTVDLKGYDILIIVEIYQNICGMSVVGKDFEKLKRFNLAEIYNPTPRDEDGSKGLKQKAADLLPSG